MSIEKSGVQTTHPDYDKNLTKWIQVDDCIGGALQVKSKGTQYLPNPDAYLSDCQPKDMAQLEAWQRSCSIASTRYGSYLQRAMFLGFTKRTKDGMVGGVFRKDPVVEVPSQLEYLIGDVDGNETDLNQQSRVVMDQALRKGRSGLLVDMPYNESVSSLKDVQSGMSVPRIQKYEAQDIINWRFARIGSTVKVVMIVLKEKYEKSLGGNPYQTQEYDQYRVLMIDENGYYVQQLHRYDSGNEVEVVTYDNIRANGQRLTSIPFFFVGSEENDYTVDDAPLYDLSEVNIAHYRNSADNEESSFITGQPTLVIAPSKSLGNPKQFAEANPNGIVLGSRQGINVGEGGNAFLLQAEANNLAKQNMLDKEQQAISIGAELISPSKQQTAEAARIQKGADTSVIATVANNVSDAYTNALKACAMFLGAQEDGISYNLNTDFFLEMLTAQDRAQWVAEINMGILPKSAYYTRLRKTGQIPAELDDGDISAAIEAQGGMSGGLI